MGHSIGVDVGGTKIAAGVVDDAGQIIEQHRTSTPVADVEAVVDAIASLVDDSRQRHEIDCVGIGLAGHVDRARAHVYFAANLVWQDVDLKSALEDRIGLPVVVENDANAAAWGEFAFDAAADSDDLLLVTVGTGVGGGIVQGGVLQRGAFGIAGEIGHVRLERDGRGCTCGQRGCLEAYASGSALVDDTRAAAANDPEYAAGLLAAAGGEASGITGPLITEHALAGDAFAIDQLAILGDWLGQGIAVMAAVLDPGVIVLGGGVSEAGDLLLAPTEVAFGSHLTAGAHRPQAEFRLARLGNSAGLVGAADLARR